MRSILNLTQHAATEDQIAAGVVEPKDKIRIAALLTFETLPTRGDIMERADALARIAASEVYGAALIGGAPYLMSPLEAALTHLGIVPFYAFSLRDSVEEKMPDGSMRKTQLFRQVGFVRGVYDVED